MQFEISFRKNLCCSVEEAIYECDFALNAWLFVKDVAALDCSDRLNPTQGRFG